MAVNQQDAPICLAVGETTDMFAGFTAQRASSALPQTTVLAGVGSPSNRSTTAGQRASGVGENGPTKTAAAGRRGAKQTQKPVSRKRGPVGRNKVAQIDHLAAARKLQWQLRRARSHSPEEVKTGRLICRHLLALLNEAADTPAQNQQVRTQVSA